MGLLSRFHSRREAESEESLPAAPQGQVFRRGDFTSTPFNDLEHAVCRQGETPHRIPSHVLDFVYGCREFRPLSAHLAAHAEARGLDPLQLRALAEFLPHLPELGLLVSPDDLSRRARAAPAEEPPPAPSLLGVVTGGRRWPLLQRCLASFQANAAAHGRAVTLLVSDTSAAPEDASACRAALAAWQQGVPSRVLFAGPEQKRRFAQALIHAGACSPEVAEFALFDPLETRFTCGANRNALLLHAAGELLACLDDDVHARLSLPSAGVGVALSAISDRDPLQRWTFPDLASAVATASGEPIDYLAAHAQMLGRSLGALLSNAQADFAFTGDTLVRRLTRHAPRVRATFCGHAGDPGIPSSAYYLYYRGENQRRLVADEARYHAALASRSVLSVAAQPTVSDHTVSPGMAMGLDLRTLLPPFFPALHAEDYSFGAVLWQSCPEALLAHLPLAVTHEPPPGKPILTPQSLSAQRPFIFFEFAHLLRRLVLRAPLPEAAGTARRLQILGNWLREIGELPTPDFTELLQAEAVREASQRLEYLQERLAEAEDAPDFWRRDVENFASYTSEAISHPGAEIPLDLPWSDSVVACQKMQQSLRLYGSLLQAWEGMTEQAKRQRQAGAGLFTPV